MPLTDDQRAMLQLLLRGQSYADIGSLLGLDEEEVRTRARTALAEIGGRDPDGDVSLTDYLLGQADPIGRADAARQLQNDTGTRDLAEQLATQLRLLVPGADLPDLPGADSAPAKRGESPAPAPVPSSADEAPAAGSTRRPFGEMASSLSRGQVIAGSVGAGVLVVVAVLAIAGVFSGGGGGGGDSSTTTTSSSQQAANASGLTRALLTPQNGGKASGVAVFARVRNVPVMEINVTHLDPSPAGKGYVIWLYGNQNSAFPLTSAPQKEKNGQLKGAVPVATQLIQALQQGLLSSVDVSLASQGQITASLKQARTSQKFPHYAGQSIVRGKITGPGAAGASGGGSKSKG